MKKLIYLISPEKIDNNFYYNLTKVLSVKKIKFLQLRLKKAKKNKIFKIAKKVKRITKKFNVKLIINDSPEIAKKVNADGCHLGQLDTDISKAKKILKKKIIGVTCHGSIKLVNEAIKDKPSYIAVGSFYKSKLKPKAKKANIKIIKKIRKRTKIPVVAIGGINDKNYKKLTRKGANYIAISSFIWNNPFLKPETAIKKFK
ncbi:MAG: thiamine phosphate synthase [Pelagibacterales bacterium MED-G40]|nr:MAG: thiamine phosphate synthase [Pelagibacterales bacterium MED-G40]